MSTTRESASVSTVSTVDYQSQTPQNLMLKTESSDQLKRPSRLCALRSYRLRIALLLMFSCFCSTSMRVDLGIAIVCMVNSTAFLHDSTTALERNISEKSSCQDVNMAELLINEGYKGTILWTPEQQSMLFSATHYGSVISVVPAGILADQFNPKLSLLIAISSMGLFTLLTPLLATWSFYALFVARVAMGLGEGFTMPTVASISARWFPSTERSRATAIFSGGNQLASSTIYWIGAVLCTLQFLGGWPIFFYLIGLTTALWMTLCILFVTNSPDQNKWISSAERNYLNDCLKNPQPQQKLNCGSIPWKSILTSMPMIANIVSMFASTFTVIIMQSFLPTYFRDVLLINLKKNGLYTTMPFLAQLVTKNVLGTLSDQIKKRKLLKPTATCKMFQVTGSLLQAVMLLILAYFVDCNRRTLAVLILIVQGAAAACATPGILTSCLSIAPAYSGTIISIAMLAGQIGSFVSPNIVAFFRKHGTPQEWTTIFTLTACVLTFSAIFFSIFGSAEKQSWALAKEAEDTQQHSDGNRTVKVIDHKSRRNSSSAESL